MRLEPWLKHTKAFLFFFREPIRGIDNVFVKLYSEKENEKNDSEYYLLFVFVFGYLVYSY